MLKVMVSIDADLPSSIALRYICMMAHQMEMEIQTIHVHNPAAAPASGTGWARHTWEKELIEEGKKEISQLLIAESGFCPVLNPPIIVSGDRDKEVLGELEKGGYDLFVEGAAVAPLPSRGGPAKRVKSHLYQHIPTPVLLVQNLVPFKRVLMAIQRPEDADPLFSSFSTLFRGANLDMDLILLGKSSGGAGSDEATARKAAENHGLRIGEVRISPESCSMTENTAGMGECGMVAILLEKAGRGEDRTLEFLESVRVPVLFCWR